MWRRPSRVSTGVPVSNLALLAAYVSVVKHMAEKPVPMPEAGARPSPLKPGAEGATA